MLSTANFPGASLRHLGYAVLLISAILAKNSVEAAVITTEELSSKTDESQMRVRIPITDYRSHILAELNKTPINRTVVFENGSKAYELSKNETSEKKSETSTVENWCVIWYLGAFGSLVCFFLIITCTELFFGNPLYRRENLEAYVQQFHTSDCHKPWKPATPPPPYHLFAPPGYKETMKKFKKQQSKLQQQPKSKLQSIITKSSGSPPINVYIVPVHRIRLDDNDDYPNNNNNNNQNNNGNDNYHTTVPPAKL